MKLGNVILLLGGRIVIPPQFERALYSILSISSVLLLETPFFVMSNRVNSTIFGCFFTLQLILTLSAVTTVAITAFSDPGIVPGREF